MFRVFLIYATILVAMIVGFLFFNFASVLLQVLEVLK